MKLMKTWKVTYTVSITLKWNYAKHYVDLAMAKYVMKQLTKYGHVAPLIPQHCP